MGDASRTGVVGTVTITSTVVEAMGAISPVEFTTEVSHTLPATARS
jgi:hypothetical protein